MAMKYYFKIKVTGNDINSDETSFENPAKLYLDPESPENILKSGYTHSTHGQICLIQMAKLVEQISWFSRGVFLLL